jgi:hypothetical protein
MKGFESESIGGMLSVFGPFVYSYSSCDLVLDQVQDILIPGGLLKFTRINSCPGSKLNEEYRLEARRIEQLLRERNFVFTVREDSADEIGYKGTHLTYLCLKADPRIANLTETAERLMAEDAASREAAKEYFPDRRKK